MKPLLLTIALLFSTPLLTGCAVNSVKILKPEKPQYVSIKNTVFFRDYLAITPQQKFQLIETDNKKSFVLNLDGKLNYEVDENLCLNGGQIAINPPPFPTEYWDLGSKTGPDKRIMKLFGEIPCFSIVDD